MKYLYLLFRLFVCPHKFFPFKDLAKKDPAGSDVIVGCLNRCIRCGKMQNHKIEF